MNSISYIQAGWLIDGTGGPVQDGVVLKIEAGHISAILASSDLVDIDPALVTDLSHCTIFPPLVDSHLHLFMSGTTDMGVRDRQLVADCNELSSAISRHLHDLLSHGVLGVRDGGDRGGCALKCKGSEVDHPEVTIKAAGRAYHKEGRYGGLIGRPVPEGKSLAEMYLEDEPEGDLVKVVNSGLNSLTTFGKETLPQFTEDELRELVEVAEKRNQKVMVHANGREPVRRGVAAGCHSIEHGFFMGEENLKLMARMGTYWVPTVFTMKAYGLNIGATRGSADKEVITKMVEHQLNQLRRGRSLGVHVALGTDAGSLGVLHGESMVEEMKLFKKAGFTLPEIIHCATVAGADLLGIKSLSGIVEGARASFLVSRGAPSQLPRKMLYLESIYVDGFPSRYYRKNPIKHIGE
ncbi:amidohydrolase family protein [Desulforhopalus sp. 52FAK]